MELLDRYLHAVRFWLPAQQKQDIIAELSDDIRSQVEEKETALGRKLNKSELEAVLKQVGPPMLVASRYLPQQYLIGPVLYPAYKLVLKIVMLCYLVPWSLTWIGLMIYDPAYRAAYFSSALPGMLVSRWVSFWMATFISIGVVTIVFAVLDRVQAKTRFLENWNPAKLPPVRDKNHIARGASIFEIVGNVIFTTWFVQATWSLKVFDRLGIRVTLAPVWRSFLFAIILLSLANLALAGANLARPYWTRKRATLRLLVDVLGSTLFAWLCRSHVVAQFTASGLSEQKIVETTRNINRGIAELFPYAIGVGLIVVAVDLFRIWRSRAEANQSKGSMGAGVLSTSALG